MTEQFANTADLFEHMPGLISDLRWPVLLLDTSYRVLAASRAAMALLGMADDLTGAAAGTLVAEQERPAFEKSLGVAFQEQTPVLQRLRLRQSQQLVELELRPLPMRGLMTVVFYPVSYAAFRERRLHGFNRLAARLPEARSREALIDLLAHECDTLGLGYQVALLEPGSTALRVIRDTSREYQAWLFSILNCAHEDIHPISDIPLTTPVYQEVLGERRAIADEHGLLIFQELFVPQVVQGLALVQQLAGCPGMIVAPLQAGDLVYGTLALWGAGLAGHDLLFVETLAQQVGAAFAQLAQRQAMEEQIERLESLAATGHAVTTLGSLDQVLRAICEQAQALLGGEFAAIWLPLADGETVKCYTATGRWSESLIDDHRPISGSLIGLVMREGVGRCVNDIHHDQAAYAPALERHELHAALYQPLLHRGILLGVLDIAHSEAGRFSQADLGYLARYAEYAAVAIANAKLHAALRETASDNARLYRKAEETRSYLALILQNVPDALLICRRDMTLHPLNEAPLRAVGHRGDLLEDRLFTDLAPHSYHEQLIQYWQNALEGEHQRFEIELYRGDGSTFIASVSADPIPGSDEVLVVITDVSARHKLYQSEKMAALGRLVAGVAHEMNNPLAVILGLTQLQLMDNPPAELRDDLKNIERSAFRASEIVRQLQMFVRPKAALPQPLDLAHILGDALAQLREPFEAAGIVLHNELTSELARVSGDQHLMRQVFINIIDNAIQALEQVQPPAERVLLIRAWVETSWVRVTISDSGPGIAPEHLQRVFDPFFTTQSAGKGSGLGLAVVYTIVQQHGGQVWAESTRGHGTTFHLKLPLDQP